MVKISYVKSRQMFSIMFNLWLIPIPHLWSIHKRWNLIGQGHLCRFPVNGLGISVMDTIFDWPREFCLQQDQDIKIQTLRFIFFGGVFRVCFFKCQDINNNKKSKTEIFIFIFSLQEQQAHLCLFFKCLRYK